MEEETQQAYTATAACGGQLKAAKDVPSAIYRGEQVFFCTQACLRVFEQDPDPFMAGEIEHPVEHALHASD